VRQLGDEVSRCRRHQQGICTAREIDVRHAVVHALIPKRLPYATAGQRLKGCRSDELGAGSRKRNIHLGTRLDQQAHQFGSLVGGDAAGHTKHDAPALKFAHDIKIPPIGNQRGF